MTTLVAVDFETDAIAPRPDFPPKPAGIAIYVDGGNPMYISWGHPSGNSAKYEDVQPRLKNMFANENYEFVMHNAPFDLSVAEEKMDIVIPWNRCHDTMLMAFLLDPFGELSLKPLAEKHLNEPPEEQLALRDWLVRHGIVRSNDKQWGAHIAKAPAGIVAPYAIGDVRKTLNLYKRFKAQLESRSKIC